LKFPWHQIPNAITVLRILLIFPIAYCLAKALYQQALVLFFIAGMSDALDGYLARSFNWTSRFGSVTDPLADKALLIAVYITLTIKGLLPVWLLFIVFGRDLIIVGGALIYHMAIGAYTMRPSIWGKLSTFSQITYALILIVDRGLVTMPTWSTKGGLWVVAGLSITSGLHYIMLWGQKYFTARRHKSG